MQMEQMLFDGFLTEATVDGEGRNAETIRNCLLCGLTSLNGHTFAASAFRNAKALYEGVHVYLNHDPEKQISRDVRDLAGIVSNVRLDSLGRPRGDILLGNNKAGAELRALFEFSQKAEKHGAKLKDVGFSHVASYTFAAGDRTIVEDITHAYSVDCVIRPASTSSFQESEKHDMEKTFNPSEALERLRSNEHEFEWSKSSFSDRAAEATRQAHLPGDARSAELFGAGLVHDPSAESRCGRVDVDITKTLKGVTFTH